MVVAYLGEDIELGELDGGLGGPEGVLLGGLAKKLPSRVFIEQLVTMRSERGARDEGIVAGEVSNAREAAV